MIHFGGMRRKVWGNGNATLIIGRRRQGKSTLLAMIAREALAAGYKVYSNYPIAGCVKIPKFQLKDGKIVTDKAFCTTTLCWMMPLSFGRGIKYLE